MHNEFTFDVFISYSPVDIETVQKLAEKLRSDGLRIWLDIWERRKLPNSHLSTDEIRTGLENSRTLLLCMSSSIKNFDEASFEAQSIKFRDPLNSGRRLIPIVLDDAPLPAWLASLLYVDWRSRTSTAYSQIRDACQPPPSPRVSTAKPTQRQLPDKSLGNLIPNATIRTYASFASGIIVATVGGEIWSCNLRGEVGQQRILSTNSRINSIAASTNGASIVGCRAGALICINIGERGFFGHSGPVLTVISISGDLFLSGGADGTLCTWKFDTITPIAQFAGHTAPVRALACNENLIVSGSQDNTIRIWDYPGRCIRVLEGHTAEITALAISVDGQLVLSGSHDKTFRVWSGVTGQCFHIFEGHTDTITAIALHPNNKHVLTGSGDRTVRLWDAISGECLRVFDGHRGDIGFVKWTSDNSAVSGDQIGTLNWTIRRVDFTVDPLAAVNLAGTAGERQIQYTNAKVLLVGESGAGKSSLSVRLATNVWEPNTESTVGAWATQWKLPAKSELNVEREIWLWDFGGQSDQRIIHQLYMADAAVAVLIFNGQKDELFESIGQWDRDVLRASPSGISKILVAARKDAGSLKYSLRQIKQFIQERGFNSFIETSAKTGEGCAELRESIFEAVQWDNIPWRSTPVVFKRLKDQIVALKDAGHVLMRFSDLSNRLRLVMEPEETQFTDDQLRAVLNLLSGPGVVAELQFGGWILFKPEYVNAYGQALILTIRDDPSELGCISEDRVLAGDLKFSSRPPISPDDEKYILLDLHRQLIARGLCVRQHTDKGNILVLPSFYRRQRPRLKERPPTLVSYEYDGFSDEIHATLVVHLIHTNYFRQEELWRDAADFTSTAGKKIGIEFTSLKEGRGKVEVYAQNGFGSGQLIQFIGYVHEHLKQRAEKVKRTRHYVCSCGEPISSHGAVIKRLESGKSDIVCSLCEERVLLKDELEEIFTDPKNTAEVKRLEQEVDEILDNESKERVLVGEVISTVALAGHIPREKTVSDHGIDMEVEFKNSKREASGKLIFLQLKSGDSHLSVRKSDGARIFTIKNPRHVEYWINQIAPVYLVIRNSKAEIEWMEIREYLKEQMKKHKRVSQIVFKGQKFDAQSILAARY